MNQQFQIEKEHFIKFIEASNQSISSVEMPASEPPDLQCKFNNQNIGVEHSRIKSNPITKIEVEFDRLTKLCNDELKKNTDQIIMVDWTLKGNYNYSSKERKSVVENLVEEVVTTVQQSNQSTEIINVRHKYPFIKDFKVTIKPLIKLECSQWTRTKFWTVGGLRISDLNQIINEKNEDVIKYIDNYEYVWLFLVLEGNKSSDTANVKPADFNYNPNWLFDKIIIFNLGDNKYCELNKKNNT